VTEQVRGARVEACRAPGQSSRPQGQRRAAPTRVQVGVDNLPRPVELAGKKVVGVAAGGCHTAVWTEEGELFTFGVENYGQLGHRGDENELVPSLVEALMEA
jgi:alpha-tubulin suppressor-like RCC1 family protein